MTPQDQLVQKMFERLWVEINRDVDEDGIGNSIDAVSAKDWMEYRAFPLLFPGHCFRCHGFEDGPCEQPYGHGSCPACVEEARVRAGISDEEWDQRWSHLPNDCQGPPCGCPEAAHE